jgi:hypothetical protein
VSIAPTTGTGFGAYNTDYLNIDVSIDTDVVTTAAYDKLAVELTHTPTTGGSTTTVKLNDGLTCTHATTANYSLPILTTTTAGVTTATTATATTSAALVGASCAATKAAAADLIWTIPFSATVNSVVLDLANVTGSSAAKLSIKSVDAGTTTHENEAVAVTAWLDSDEDEIRESTDKFPSTTETATFYDAANVTVTPRVERFVGATSGAVLNGALTYGDVLGTSLAFSPALNLDQVGLGNFTFSATGGTATVFTPELLSGNTSHSAAGKIYGTLDHATPASFTLAASTAYTFSAVRTIGDAAGTGPVTSTTAGYTVPVQATAGITSVTGVLVDQAEDSEQTDLTDTSVQLRTGVKTFKYTMSSTTATANVPVIAYVKATAVTTGGTITVGSTVVKKNQATLVSGVTDADGKFSVSVTSSEAKISDAYTVNFYALLSTGAYTAAGNFTAAYEAAAAKTMAQTSTILSGSTVEAKYSLKDQFGKAVSANASGTAYTVRVQATDTTKLKKYATFVNGAATVSFTNYLAKGQNDTVTAAIGTGLDTAYADASITTGDNLTATLYNPEDAAGVTTSASRTGNITYDDFITGAASSTNVAPADASAIAHTGTVVDTTGVGIPGALVTISGKGLQFVKTAAGVATGDYAQDSITVSADAAGAFEVKIWAHQASSTGIAVITTAGGKTATTTLKTYLPATLVNGNNLSFSWKLPAIIVKNTTYAVTAKLTDKWGNGVATSTGVALAANAGVTGVTFQGLGSLEVNSVSTAVSKNFDKNGSVTVFVRSVKDIAGPGNLTATLGAANYSATSAATATALVVAEIATDATATKWNETSFKNEISTDVEVLNAAPKATITKAATSSAVVKNVAGLSVKLVRGSKSATKVATSNNFKISLKGGTGTVKVYVNGVKVASK